jgi:hypothetical protein
VYKLPSSLMLIPLLISDVLAINEFLYCFGRQN